MFGFKHTMNKLQHNTSDHKVVRTRLYGRLLQVNGPGHLNALYPHLVARLDSSLSRELAEARVLQGAYLDALSVTLVGCRIDAWSRWRFFAGRADGPSTCLEAHESHVLW